MASPATTRNWHDMRIKLTGHHKSHTCALVNLKAVILQFPNWEMMGIKVQLSEVTDLIEHSSDHGHDDHCSLNAQLHLVLLVRGGLAGRYAKYVGPHRVKVKLSIEGNLFQERVGDFRTDGSRVTPFVTHPSVDTTPYSRQTILSTIHTIDGQYKWQDKTSYIANNSHDYDLMMCWQHSEYWARISIEDISLFPKFWQTIHYGHLRSPIKGLKLVQTRMLPGKLRAGWPSRRAISRK